jgi:hypothetical protein
MKRIGILSTLLVLCGPLLAQQPQPRKTDPSDWVFAFSETENRLVTLGSIDESVARLLTLAVCSKPLKLTSIRITGSKQSSVVEGTVYEYESDEGIAAGDYCLLNDNSPFLWGRNAETPPPRHTCMMGFAKAAGDLAGRKVDSCYLLGPYGTGFLELVEFQQESSEGRLAALLLSGEGETPDERRYWAIKFPSNDKIWTGRDRSLRPERFQYLFTMLNDSKSEVAFIGVEWDGPDGAYLTLYRPVGKELKPIVENYRPRRQVLSRK